MKKIKIAFCCKCSDAITKRTTNNGISGFELIGCKKLSEKRWEDGLPKDIGKIWNQSNCPLIGKGV